ncbi:hypothetical protein [Corynebacterium marinum]|uniref:Uncharacterized protein n=1 Tax=Corynebacterium marinum DSM 44953 TaxID=1224162 RepID=A0A0B6TNH6_9CORY|nr:hypothetical protein [Corynebacterium marinum]AJK67799.1 hypothetical protein B840_00795 [Corynebacterium marinum DSM 44953]GGO12325.1 hypothetical protein GCM10010980_04480 [Corynebacterium marinum]
MTDYYSLDDTLAGRIAQAGMVGTAVALPDYFSSRPLRALVTAAIGLGGAGLVAVLNSFDDDLGNDPAVMAEQLRTSIGGIGSVPGPDSDTPPGDFSTASPAQTWTVIIGALVVIVALVLVDAALQRRLVAWLRRRGVSRPNTWLGGVASAAVFAVAEIAHQRRGGRA